jgi:hypothetical protein
MKDKVIASDTEMKGKYGEWWKWQR